MSRSSLEYLRQLQSLLPWGKAWNRGDDSVLSQFLYGEADELARIDDRAQDLLRERNTLTATELLNDHEAEFGLPDVCTRDLDIGIGERRIAVNVKKTSIGGQNEAYFIDVAKRYGFDADITTYVPFWCGIGAAGEPCGDAINLFYWKLTIYTDYEIIYFLAGEGAAGDPLQKLNDLLDAIFCYANKYKPAHTVLIQSIAGPGFDEGFDEGFYSLPSGSETYLTGAFSKGFSFGFDVNLGGGFDAGFDPTGFVVPS